jgi:hypothetical protein
MKVRIFRQALLYRKRTMRCTRIIHQGVETSVDGRIADHRHCLSGTG